MLKRAARRQRKRERLALLDTTRALQEHFNGCSWDRKVPILVLLRTPCSCSCSSSWDRKVPACFRSS